MTFANVPVVFLACLCPVVVLLLHLWDARRRAVLVRRLGELPVIGRVTATASPERRAAKAVIAAVGLTAVVLALARPQIVIHKRVEQVGLDVVVAVDLSKSMLVDDVAPDRLSRARAFAGELIDALPDDRIGPIVFAGAASHFPVTEDREVATRFLNDLGPADLPPGSNVAEVFRVARCLLRPDLYDDLGCARIGRRGHGGEPLAGELKRVHEPKEDEEDVDTHEERGKAIVVITDGGESDDDTLREVQAARELGIAVFVVGVGTEKGGEVHETDTAGKRTDAIKHTRDGAVVTSKRDDEAMRAIAAAAGDDKRYFVLNEQGDVQVAPVLAALESVQRGSAAKKVDEKYDVFQPFLFIGFMLLVIEPVIATRRRREFPEER